MRKFILYFAAALIPTVLSASPAPSTSGYAIEGIWYDSYTDTELEIRSHRRGIQVRRNGRKWQTFNDMGRGVFDDCKGSAIVFLGRGEITYRRKRKAPIYLSRFNRFGRDNFDDRRDRNRAYGRADRRNNDYGNRDRFRGDWYCEDRGIRLTIETYGQGGIRARQASGDWDYYNDYNNNRYSNRRGSGYYFDGDILIWTSNNGRRKMRFRKR